MSKYTVRYERDESGWWVATVKGVRGCRTQWRTIDQARRRIREALSLFVDDAESSILIDDVRLPVSDQELVRQVLSNRKRVEDEAVKLQSSAAQAAHVLTNVDGR